MERIPNFFARIVPCEVIDREYPARMDHGSDSPSTCRCPFRAYGSR